MQRERVMRRGMFAFDSGKKTYLATTMGGAVDTVFSLLISKDAEQIGRAHV